MPDDVRVVGADEKTRPGQPGFRCPSPRCTSLVGVENVLLTIVVPVYAVPESLLVGSVVASLLITPASDTTIQVDLPPDFDLPLGEELNEAEKQPEEKNDQKTLV